MKADLLSTPVALTPEIELGLLCARSQPTAAEQARIVALATDPALEWGRFWGWVRPHGVAALVGRTLTTALPADAVPAHWRTRIEHDQRRQMLSNVSLLRTTVQIVQLLAAHGITAVPYKGVVLGWLLYGQVGMRHAGDVDILLRPEDVLAARRILTTESDLREAPITAEMSPATLALYLREFNTVSLEDRAADVLVELQWMLTRPYLNVPPASEQLLAELRPVQIGDTTLMQPPIETILLMLSVHAAKHGWSRLVWLVDVHELLTRYPDLDWERVWQTAHAWRGERLLAATLALVAHLFARPLPPAAQRHAALPAVRRTVARIVPTLYAATLVDMPDKWPALQILWPLRSGWRDRLRLLRRLFDIKEPDIAFVQLPTALHWLYPAARLLRLALAATGLLARRRAIAPAVEEL